MGDAVRTAAPAWIGAAAGCWAANAALGAGVALGLVRTGRFRWVHHALYTTTTTATAAATAACALSAAPRARRAALVLAPALVPLAVLPRAGTPAQGHPRRHALLALCAAPCYAAALAAARPARP
ncbi:hypothetical protein ACSNO4_10520 [Kocuria flava]|uniref:hypothetical protein n=1 Tax=Kocuria flava TaxID=446860 RepID=UPI003F1E28E9